MRPAESDTPSITTFGHNFTVILVPPVFRDAAEQARVMMERDGYTKFKELTPLAGCRRFKLS